MNGLLKNVSVQIQRAISEAINEQVLPQIQASLRTGSGRTTQKGDRNEDPKKLIVRKLGVALEVNSPENDFVTRTGRTLMTPRYNWRKNSSPAISKIFCFLNYGIRSKILCREHEVRSKITGVTSEISQITVVRQ